MDNLQAIFCGGFFRAVSCEAVSPGTLPQRRHLWAHPQEHFPCASLDRFFACPLSLELLRAFYLVLSSVRFPADQFCWRPIAGVFALRFLMQGLFSALSFAKLFWHALSQGFSLGFGFSPVHLPCKLPQGRFPWTLSRVRLQCALSGVDFWFNFLPGLFPCNFLPGRLQWEHLRGLFVRSFARVSSVRFFAGTFYPHSLVGSFFVPFLYVLFLWTFSRSFFRALFRGAIFSGTLSQWRYRSAHTQEPFLCTSLQWLFWHALSQKFLQCAFLKEIFFTTAFRKLLPHSPSQEFSRGLFTGASLVHLSHGRFPSIFRRVVFSALSCWRFFSAIFSGAFSVRFFAGKISMGSIAGAFSVHSLLGSLYHALFCNGDIHKLLRWGCFLTVFRSAFFHAVLR